MEVWFDQNELVGGDAWDAKIKKQIQSCALFVPIISANTQERREGYFRLEWHLAEDRTRLIAKGTPFLVPVVVDGTSERNAIVPEVFTTVQWTKLPSGETSAAFVTRVQKLLGGPSAPTATAASTAPTDTGVTPAGRTGLPLWVGVALGVVVLVLIGFLVMRPSGKDASSTQKPAPDPKPQVASQAAPIPVVNDKSIAVLPFTNMSEEKDANAFFADGIHEDIITNLSNIQELKVTSRTSVMEYRDTNKKIRQIASELGVAYVLEGSVRRAGNKVRVTGQLINARNDDHIWAKSYDRDLTDIFAIQSELSQEIASALSLVLSPQEKKLVERRPTENVAAYDLVLKARMMFNSPSVLDHFDDYQRLLEEAVRLDPNYAGAYAELAHAYVVRASSYPSTADLAKARSAIDTATRLAPGSFEAIYALGDFYYYGHKDYGRALAEYEKLARVRPNDPIYLNRIAGVLRRQGRWAESLAGYKKLQEVDPGNLRNRHDIVLMLAAGRRYDQAIVEMRRLIERASDNLVFRLELGQLAYLANGSTKEIEKLLVQIGPDDLVSDYAQWGRIRFALARGDINEAKRLDLSHPLKDNRFVIQIAYALAAQGDHEGALARLGSIPSKLRALTENRPEDSVSWAQLGLTEVLLGRNVDAVHDARKAVELLPESRDAILGAENRASLAQVLAWTGNLDSALVEYAHLVRTPTGLDTLVSVPFTTSASMSLDPRFAPLRSDPRWEALINDPKNSEPLF